MSRVLRLTLCLALLAVSWPAAAVERVVEINTAAGVVPLKNVAAPVDLKVAPAALQTNPGAQIPTAGVAEIVPAQPEPGLIQAGARIQTPGAAKIETGPRAEPGAAPDAAPTAQDPTAGWVESSRRFDNASRAPKTALVLGGAAAAVPAVALAAQPLAHAFHALAPYVNTASYDAANALSVAFPLPEAYRAFRSGSAKDFPLFRASLGALGTMALGLVNATVLGKPLWGVMHAFISLGILAPYVIGKILEKRGRLKPYEVPANLAQGSRARKILDRVLHDKAVLATAVAGLVMLAAAAGLYAGAAAFIPALLAAHLSSAAIAQLLLWVQVAKGAMFVSVFAPDVAALLRGKPTHGFSKSFTSIYLGSVAAFTAWGFMQAAVSPAGAIRDQYLIHGARNAAEAVASALSLLAIHRAEKKARRAAQTESRTSH